MSVPARIRPPVRRGVADDLGVVAGVGRRRHRRRERVDDGLPADVVEHAAVVERARERDRVDDLALAVHLEDGAVDGRVRPAVEVLGLQQLRDDRDRVLRDQHRAEDRLLGVDVLGRDVGWPVGDRHRGYENSPSMGSDGSASKASTPPSSSAPPGTTITLSTARTSPVHGQLHAVRAERLDRLVELDLAPVDADPAGLPDRVGDVGRRDRPVQPVLGARPPLDREHRAVERVRHVARLVVALGLVAAALLRLALHLGDAGVGRRLGQLPRAEVIAHVAGGDLDHVALAAELLDVLEQDRLCRLACHFLPLQSGRRAAVCIVARTRRA